MVTTPTQCSIALQTYGSPVHRRSILSSAYPIWVIPEFFNASFPRPDQLRSCSMVPCDNHSYRTILKSASISWPQVRGPMC
ncbi:hypothetical protein AcV7_007010 [Taiwanofungus camphoratus]|nr:hypothetical protein AcV7_007010 [Antrodia cinnamomea]